jgi:hypothetical protein
MNDVFPTVMPSVNPQMEPPDIASADSTCPFLPQILPSWLPVVQESDNKEGKKGAD